MVADSLKLNVLSRDNDFYKNYYHYFLTTLISLFFIVIILTCIVLYQVIHRPLPFFQAMPKDGKAMVLTPFLEPNLLPATILDWASTAAVLAYTFDFEGYEQQLALARPYFTEAGWVDYANAIRGVLASIEQRKLFVYGVVAGTPVISNQGEIPGKGYVWRVQIPFLVSYLSSISQDYRNYTVVLSIVRVPTTVNPSGIGIDQFIMR